MKAIGDLSDMSKEQSSGQFFLVLLLWLHIRETVGDRCNLFEMAK